MTYRGHSVLQTLIRCHFSPSASTGQRYIYTGCAQGRILSRYFLNITMTQEQNALKFRKFPFFIFIIFCLIFFLSFF